MPESDVLPAPPGEPFLFISYASVDRPKVIALADGLRQAGLEIWIDQAGIAGGAAYGTEIANAIKASAAVVLMCSSASLASRNVRQEIMLAWRYDRPILPLLLEPTTFPDDIAYWLEGAQWIEVLDRPVDEWLPLLGRALTRHGLSLASLPSEAAPAADRSPELVASGPGNLPLAGDPLIGREREVREVVSLLGQGRWVTLTGPGGTGKTRLGLEAARRAAADFPGGAWFVDLAPVTEPGRMLPAVAAALEISEAPGLDWSEVLARQIGDERLLLVLDNVEQIAAGVEQVSALLGQCAGLTVLATSRVALNAAGEWAYAVAPFDLPDTRRLPPLPVLAQNPAVQLFVERARAARPDFVLTDGVARPVAEICERLDGLPLAIELAAARVRLLTPAAILTRLGSRLNLLTSGQALTRRQQTMRDAIAWSYDLLAPSEQLAFRRLSVFAGGATVEAAEAVIADGGARGSPLDDVSALVDHSLLRVEHRGGDDTPRVRMLETIREYAAEQLAPTGEEERIRSAHARFFLDLMQARVQDLASPQPGPALTALRAEDDNLRAALDWLAAHALEDRRDAELQLAERLVWYWRRLGRYQEAAARLADALRRNPDAPAVLRARALQGAAFIAARQGDHHGAIARFEDALALQRATGERSYEADTLQFLAFEIAEASGDYARASALLEAALAIRQELGDEIKIAETNHDLGAIDLFRGAYEAAIERFSQAIPIFRRASDARNLALVLTDLTAAEMLAGHAAASRHAAECLTLWRTLDDRYAVVQALVNYGRVLQLSGAYAEATPLLDEALADARELGDTAGISLALYGLGLIALANGEIEPAFAQVSESLRLSHAAESTWHIAERLEALAVVWSARGDAGRAAKLLGAAAALREEGGFPVPPAEQADLQRTIDRLTMSLGGEALASAMDAGRKTPLDDIVNEALSA
jgi:predicted ATPase